jgi:hypothetical protein
MTKEEKFESFLKVFESEIDKRSIWSADIALLHLLKQYVKEIVGWYAEAKKSAYKFQKFFRQCDVTNSGHSDMAIWHLIGQSEAFDRAWKKSTARERSK